MAPSRDPGDEAQFPLDFLGMTHSLPNLPLQYFSDRDAFLPESSEKIADIHEVAMLLLYQKGGLLLAILTIASSSGEYLKNGPFFQQKKIVRMSPVYNSANCLLSNCET